MDGSSFSHFSHFSCSLMLVLILIFILIPAIETMNIMATMMAMMMTEMKILILIPLLAKSSLAFKESLNTYSINNGVVTAIFEFNQEFKRDLSKSSIVKIFGTFPRVIEELVEEFDIYKMKLSFSRGLWRLEDWGEAPIPMTSTGISLYTWLSPSSHLDRSSFDSPSSHASSSSFSSLSNNDGYERDNKNRNGNKGEKKKRKGERGERGGGIDKRWELLCQQLSGLFCGSINLITPSKTIIPKEIYPEAKRYPEKAFRMALLPRETFCTENLAPWLKLLPCKSQAGLASLLNPLEIFEAAHLLLDISIDVEKGNGNGNDSNESESKIILTQRLMVTMDMKRWKETLSWSFKSLFDRTIERACPLAKESKTMLFLPPPQHLDWQLMERSDNPVYDSTTHAVYTTNNIIGKNVGININSSYSNLNPSRLSVERRLRGGGKDLATLYIKWTNLTDESLKVKHLDLIPWFLQIYTHTLKFKRNERGGNAFPSPLISIVHSYLKTRSTQMEMIFDLPPKGSLIMTMECMRKFLQFIDFPFDPNRGLDIPGAIVQYYRYNHNDGNGDNDNKENSFQYEFVTPTIVMSIPTPDFTMTYNIITLSSTILSIFYGAFFNFTYRRFYKASDVPSSLVSKIRDQILKGIKHLRVKLKRD